VDSGVIAGLSGDFADRRQRPAGHQPSREPGQQEAKRNNDRQELAQLMDRGLHVLQVGGHLKVERLDVRFIVVKRQQPVSSQLTSLRIPHVEGDCLKRRPSPESRGPSELAERQRGITQIA
jgi:hypothetical protein